MTKKIDIKTLENEHFVILPKCELLCKELVRQIEFLIDTNKIILGFPLQFRAKKFDSIKNKIENGRFTIKSSILELQDLAGIRIITLFKRDAKSIIKILSNEFIILSNYNTQDKLDDESFGYSSTHLVCTLKDEWLTLPSFSELNKIKFEIQIRTVSQHSWAEVSNKLQYKQDNSVPKPLKRSISRISALLEIVDNEFESLLTNRDEYITNIDLDSYKTDDVKLNVDNLKEILDKKLPINFKVFDDPYSELLDNLNILEFKTSNSLIKLIDNQFEKAIEKNTEICNDFKSIYKKSGNLNDLDYHLEEGDLQRVLSGTFYSQVGLIRTMLEFEIGKNIFDEIRKRKKTSGNSRLA